LHTRRLRRLCIGTAWVVVSVAIGIACTSHADNDASHAIGGAVRSPGFATLPASLGVGAAIVQLDAHRAIAFGDVTWNQKTLTVSNDGVLVDFASKTAAKVSGPKLDDGLARARAAVTGSKVLFFGMECSSGRLPSTFDGEGDVADPCPDADLMLATLDVSTGAWATPVTAPAPVGGKVRWIVDATMVGRTAVIEWYRSGSGEATFTAYDTARGTWRAMDDAPGLIKGECSTDRYVVRETYDQSSGPNPRLLLLDPRRGTSTTVALPEEFAGAGDFDLACAANRVAVRTIVPPFAFVSADYSPATRTWRRLPPAPHDPLAQPWRGVGDVVVIPGAPASAVPSSLMSQTLDLTQPVPQWRSSRHMAPPKGVEVAMGVHSDGRVIARNDDVLMEFVVDAS
jgi:hypothetical protein